MCHERGRERESSHLVRNYISILLFKFIFDVGLTHWPLWDLNEILISFKQNFSLCWLRCPLCPQMIIMIVTGPHWWVVNISSGNGLVPSGTKPLPEPMLTSWWRHQMKAFSASLALCEGNSPVTDEFSSQRATNVELHVSLMWVSIIC